MAVSYGKRSDLFLLQRSRVCPCQNREAGTSGNWKSCLIHCTNFIPSCLSSLHPPCWCQSHNCCLLFSLQVISDSLRPHGLQHIRLTCPSPSPGVGPKLMSIALVMPCNHLCHPLLLLPSIFPSIRVFSQWVSCSHQVTKVSELRLQHQSFQWVFRVDFLYTKIQILQWHAIVCPQ